MPDESPGNSNSPDVQMPTEPNSAGGGPAAAGMMVPQAPEGDIQSAQLDAFHAMKLLDRAIQKIGRESDVASTLLRARAVLTKVVGDKEEEVGRFSDAEIKRMVLTLAGPSSPQAPMTPPQQGGGGLKPGMQQPGQGQPGQQPGAQ